MDVSRTSPLLPHKPAEDLTAQQGNLVSAITAVKTENKEAAKSLPPLHTLVTNLDAVQGAKELEALGRAHQPAFAVDINGEQREMERYAKDAFKVELNN